MSPHSLWLTLSRSAPLLLILCSALASAQDSGLVVPLAGTSRAGNNPEGPGAEASFGKQLSVIPHPDGQRLIVADIHNNVLKMVSLADGATKKFSGSGAGRSLDGSAEKGSFGRPFGLAASKDGKFVLVSDQHGQAIRQVSLEDGSIKTVAGGSVGDMLGQGASAKFKYPEGLGLTPDGKHALIADGGNHKIKMLNLEDGTVTLLSGSGGQGGKNGPKEVASFSFPEALATTPDGAAVMVADRQGNCIRRVSLSDGSVEEFAGTCGKSGRQDGYGGDASFNVPEAVAFTPDGKFLMVADSGNKLIRKVSMQDGGVTTLAGDLTQFQQPNSLAVTNDGQWVILADNFRIWKVSMNAVCTTLGSHEEQRAAMERERQAAAAKAQEQREAKAREDAARRAEAEAKAAAEREAAAQRNQEEAARRAAEQAQQAEEARKADEARKAEQERQAEDSRQAEEARKADEAAKAHAEEAAKKAQEEEAARKAQEEEAARKAQEEASAAQKAAEEAKPEEPAPPAESAPEQASQPEAEKPAEAAPEEPAAEDQGEVFI